MVCGKAELAGWRSIQRESSRHTAAARPAEAAGSAHGPGRQASRQTGPHQPERLDVWVLEQRWAKPHVACRVGCLWLWTLAFAEIGAPFCHWSAGPAAPTGTCDDVCAPIGRRTLPVKR